MTLTVTPCRFIEAYDGTLYNLEHVIKIGIHRVKSRRLSSNSRSYSYTTI